VSGNEVHTQQHATQQHPTNNTAQRSTQSSTHRVSGVNYFAAQDFGHKVMEDPVVSVEDNFDRLLIPQDHVSRSRNDTYYVNRTHVLRTHCTAHQREMLLNGPPAWIVGGDVFRRDEVDASHFPVFHQMDGVKVARGTTNDGAEREMKVVNGLFAKGCWSFHHAPQALLEGLARHLLGAGSSLEMVSCPECGSSL
jgi:phenylalanyl-tRNA synthetase alpha subunit